MGPVHPLENRKHYVAAALNAGNGHLTLVEAHAKTSALFCKLVWRLVADHPRAKRIPIIADNYVIHSSKKTQRLLTRFSGRVVLHFLPPYHPDDNRIERVWLDLHANVARSHRCKTIEELMGNVARYLRAYNRRAELNPTLRPARPIQKSRSVV